MGDAAQTGLDAPQHDRHAGEGLPGQLGVDHRGVGGPSAGDVVFGKGVLLAQAAAHGVEIDHGVDVARSDADAHPGPAHDLKRSGRTPVGLGHDAYPAAVMLQEPADDGRAERGVIHIAVPRDDENIQFVPAEFIHFGPAHGKKGSAHFFSVSSPAGGIRPGGVRAVWRRFLNFTF